MGRFSRESVFAAFSLLAVSGLALGGSLPSSASARAEASSAHASRPAEASRSPGSAVASGWRLPGANEQNTRDVASAIDSSNVSELGVAWTVPVTAGGIAGSDAANPVIVHGVVYVQDLMSNVMAIELATGKVLWTHDFNSLNEGPDGVNVAQGTVYAATSSAAVALSAATGALLWSRKLTRNDHEGIDMAPGYNRGKVYVSTVPVNPVAGDYLGGGEGTLWALNAKTGAPEWSFDEVGDLWGNPAINSGGGQWYPPSFDSHGNIYIGVGNPGPLGGVPGYPWGTSRPGPNLYTDSVVKLSPHGKVLWYYQLTPHDLFDWDLQDSPMLTTARGRQVVIDGGKAGILIELNAQTGRLIWKLPFGSHNGNDNDGLITEYATPTSPLGLPPQLTVDPGPFGGTESQLATNGSTTFVTGNHFPWQVGSTTGFVFPSLSALVEALAQATGEVDAVDQDTGKFRWVTQLPSTPYGAATVTNDVVFTTTFDGDLYALDANTGAVLLKAPLSAGSNAPVAVDGDYVIVGAGFPLAPGQQPLIIAYKLGAHGQLPDKAGS